MLYIIVHYNYRCLTVTIIIINQDVEEPPQTTKATKTKGKKEKRSKEDRKKRSKKDVGVVPKGEASLLGLVDLEESSVPQTAQPVSSFKLLGEDERLSMVRGTYKDVVRSSSMP